jgi:hypothetical protein
VLAEHPAPAEKKKRPLARVKTPGREMLTHAKIPSPLTNPHDSKTVGLQDLDKATPPKVGEAHILQESAVLNAVTYGKHPSLQRLEKHE